MKAFWILFLFSGTHWLNAQSATIEDGGFQMALIAKLGIRRMEVNNSKVATSAREADRNWKSETYFDSLGRTIWIGSEQCSNCETVKAYDLHTGLEVYTKSTRNDQITETFTEYDELNRRSVIETCKSGEETCQNYWFDYDEENTESMYKLVSKKHLKYDKSNHLRLQLDRTDTRELVHEAFFTPEGNLEETKMYKAGRYDYSLLYEYDEHGRWNKTWKLVGGIKNLDSALEYNEKNQVISQKSTYYSTNASYPQNNTFTSTYEYYENGLLLKSISGSVIKEYSYFTE